MARPYSPSYNSYYSPKLPAPQVPRAPTAPRLSSHPFFVDQTPYLSSRPLSGVSLQSSSSSYRSPSAGSSSSSTTSPSASAVSLNWPFGKAPSPPPYRPRHTRAASTGHTDASPATPTTPTLSPKAASLHTATAPIDRRCLQWMREAEQHEHEWILGSVASRSAGRERVFLPQPRQEAEQEAVEILHEPRSTACEAVKRRFRLNNT